MSPVIIYLPVSPVAPPKITTLDFDTIIKSLKLVYSNDVLHVHTLSDSVSESG